MAIYCELPGERLCDIGWERLFCTEQWLEEEIRTICAFGKDQRKQIAVYHLHRLQHWCINSYGKEQFEDKFKMLSVCTILIGLYEIAQPSRAKIEEMLSAFGTDLAPEEYAPQIQTPITKRTAKAPIMTLACYSPNTDCTAGSNFFQLAVCMACAETPNEKALDLIRDLRAQYLLLLERWEYAFRVAAFEGVPMDTSIADTYRSEKCILPLREYRRQQRAAERKRRQMQVDAQAQEKTEEEQRFKRMEDEYHSKLEEWKTQCAKMQQEQERAFAEQVAREMAALKNAAKQRYDQVVLENDRIISEQRKRQKDAEAALSVLGILKLVEKAQQKRVIREAEEAISSAKAAKEAAKEDCAREQREAEEQITKAEPRIREEVARAYPLPQSPEIPKEDLELLQEGEYRQFAAYLRDLTHGEPWALSEIMEKITPKIRELSIFGPLDKPLSVPKLAYILERLTWSGTVEKTTRQRRTYYIVK